MLYYLADNRNRAVSRSELLDKVWGFESEVETRATDDMIKRIRKKLADAGSVLKIDTVWNSKWGRFLTCLDKFVSPGGDRLCICYWAFIPY